MVNKSLLFPLTPYGKGTGDIEGFPSYLCRLAIAHSVSVVDLYNYLLTYGKRFSIVPFEFKRKKTLYLAALVSGSKQLRLLIKAIEELLGTSLQGTNFSMLGNGLSIPRRDISRSFKWCPVCLNEMEDEGIEPYIKLIWLLNDTLICNRHLIPLQDKCHMCGKAQHLSSNRSSFRFCSYCEAELAGYVFKTDVQASWFQYGNDLSEFLEEYIANYQPVETVDLNRTFIPKIGLSQSLYFLLKKEGLAKNHSFGCSIAAIQNYCSDLGYAKHGKYSLLVARRIAYSCGVSLYTLLSGNVQNSTAFISPELFCPNLPEYLKPQRRFKRINHNEVRSEAIKLIKQTYPPLSLKILSNHLGVSKGYLEYRFPDICKTVNLSYLKYKADLRLKVVNKAKLTALSFFTSDKYKEYSQSRKQAYKVLRQETGLPKFLLIKAIEEAFQAIHS